MNDPVSEQEFKDAVAVQFDLLKQMQPALEEPGDTTNVYMQKAMEEVLTNYKTHFEAGDLTPEHYEYIVNFWLDNVSTRTNPLP